MALHTSTGYEAMILGPHSFDSIFYNGAIEIRTGAQPATADDAATGALIGRITQQGGAWAPGNPANGLRFSRDGRYAVKNLLQEWVLKGLDTGVAGWFRLLPNTPDFGLASTTMPRIDGAIGLHEAVGDFQIFLPTLQITPATAIKIPSWWYMKPL